MSLDYWLQPGEVQSRPDVPEAVDKRPATMEQCAKETYSLPEDWEWCFLQAHGERPTGYVEIRGGVYKTVFKSGPRKGEKNRKKPEPGTSLTVSIAMKAFDEWLAKWERETGYCHQCDGTGWKLTGSGVSGNKFRSCTKCKETGWATL